MPEHVVHGQDATGAQQAQGLHNVLRVLRFVGVDHDHVIGRVGQTGKHVQGPAGDDPGSLGCDAGGCVGLFGCPLMLGLDVDRRQDAVRGHTG